MRWVFLEMRLVFSDAVGIFRLKFGAIRGLCTHICVCAETTDGAKSWRESHGAKGIHAFIDYHRSDILPSNVERLHVQQTIINSMKNTVGK